MVLTMVSIIECISLRSSFWEAQNFSSCLFFSSDTFWHGNIFFARRVMWWGSEFCFCDPGFITTGLDRALSGGNKATIFLNSQVLLFSVIHFKGILADDYFPYICSFPTIPEFSVATGRINCPTPQPQVNHGPATRATEPLICVHIRPLSSTTTWLNALEELLPRWTWRTSPRWTWQKRTATQQRM